ncbi:hypothetical protein PY365_19325 [Roseiarcaceae bacterium H3SJ34-1]|uniref:hypothetical protein n=1 Tax=Terripilifer ovatus TaxID=3032367 RepID=UPI003AB989D7|nr:hypothetical protein [Roseiarcaceae bacterium H3SJ34-1]
MHHDRLVLYLLWTDLRTALRGIRKGDLAWLVLGGGVLVAYGIADIVFALAGYAETLRNARLIWTFEAPAATAVLGLLLGLAASRMARAKALAPFLRPLPLSLVARRRAALLAVSCFGISLAVIVVGLTGLAGLIVAIDDPLASALRAAAAFVSGFAAATFCALADMRTPVDPPALAHASQPGFHLPVLGRLDRATPRWLNAWAWRLPAGRVLLAVPWIVAGLALGIVMVLATGASFATRQAVPAAAAATIGGIAVFMLALRCHPLRSPVLRTAPIGFTRAWLRLMRLPLLLSVVFFSLPASAAVAVQPSAWPISVGCVLMLFILNAAYGVFAAYFATAPLTAALSFVLAIAYAYYESLEYGRTVLLGLAGLIALLWHQARRRYRNG